jgi:hypothetical protein
MITNETENSSEEISTSRAEGNSLLVNFEILEVTLHRQVQATLITVLIMAAVLTMLGFLLFQNGLAPLDSGSALVSYSIVVVFGLVFMLSTYFKLVETLNSALVPKSFLLRELEEANFHLMSLSIPTPTGSNFHG